MKIALNKAMDRTARAWRFWQVCGQVREGQRGASLLAAVGHFLRSAV